MNTWTTKPVGDLLTFIQTGSTPPTDAPEYFNGSIPWFTPFDIGSVRDIVKSSRSINIRAIEAGEAKLSPEQTLLVTCIGNIGRVGITQIQSSYNQQITGLRFTPDIDVCFAYYWFIAHQRLLEENSNQAIVPILNNAGLKQLAFSYPQLAEQRRIAAILRAADDERRRRSYTQSLSDGLLHEVFMRMFGVLEKYPVVPFWKLAAAQQNSFVNGPFGSDLLTTELTNSGVPVIYIRDIAGGHYQRVSTSFVTHEKALQLAFCRVDSGDVLIAKVGGPPGTAVMYPTGEQSGIVTQDVIRLKPRLGVVMPQYLVAFLNSHSGRRTLTPILVAGTRERFGLTPLKEISIPLPPIELQREFAVVAAMYEHVRRQQQEYTHQIDHLFNTLLHRAFTGEL